MGRFCVESWYRPGAKEDRVHRPREVLHVVDVMRVDPDDRGPAGNQERSRLRGQMGRALLIAGSAPAGCPAREEKYGAAPDLSTFQELFIHREPARIRRRDENAFPARE